MYSTTYHKSRALIIGVNHYQYVSPLGYAVQDAEAIAETLISDLSFDAEAVEVLLDRDATKSSILRSFMSLCLDGTDSDDRLVVFFAGHGHTEHSSRGDVGFLVPCDGKTNDLSTLIRWDELTRNADLISAKHLLFLMDACYGGLAVTRSTKPGSMRFLRDMMQRTSRQVLTAGKADEVVADLGGPVPGHSVFTGHLLNALRGAAKDNLGNLTAAGVTAYVYQSVGFDGSSNQTPHFGHLQGDGDMIFHPIPNSPSEIEVTEGIDTLYAVPAVLHGDENKPMNDIDTLKDLLSESKYKIRLFDLIAQHTREALSTTADDYFPVQGIVNNDVAVDRLSKYEIAVMKLIRFEVLLGFWGGKDQSDTLTFPIKRLAERLTVAAGSTFLINMRWYPIELLFYAGGIGALASSNYSNLYQLMQTRVPNQSTGESSNLVIGVTHPLAEISTIFKVIPGHERNHVPRSEYLFKFFQPICDDLLFIGADYEAAFDRFEVFYALQYAHEHHSGALDHGIWAPVGRFGWKSSHHYVSPLKQIRDEANGEGQSWKPLQAGLFGGSFQRFDALADALESHVRQHSWL